MTTTNQQYDIDTSTHHMIAIDDLRHWVTHLFAKAGLRPGDAAIVAQNIVEAESRAVRSHGLIMLPVYIQRIQGGGIKSAYELTIDVDTGPMLVVDGDGGPGQVLAKRAMDLAIERAPQYGIAYVALRNSNHIGMLASYGLQAARAGLIGLVMTTSGPSISVAGGKGRRLGNNAFCVAAPGDPDPLVFDMATGEVACGKVRVAALHSEPIGSQWISDKEGRLSHNPVDLDSGGSVMPFGGHKGYGMAVIIDILAGLFAGSVSSMHVLNQRGNSTSPTGASQCFIALDPARTTGRDALAASVGHYAQALRNSLPLDPERPVLAPGDPELAAYRDALRNGIVLSGPVLRLANDIAADLGCEPLTLSE
jgi:LDH2 family malate/lactate/ureidoglycolate dehydrogenase